MYTARPCYSIRFLALVYNECKCHQIALITFLQHYLVAMATSLHRLENKLQIYHLHVKRFHIWWKDCKTRTSISRDIWLNVLVFWPCRTWRSQMSCQLCSYWTELYEIFTRYTGIICAVNVHIEVAISHSVSECQSDERGEFAIFFTKSVAMATSLEISKK